jgi:riboflavin kinase/FMN adenylyltransferase
VEVKLGSDALAAPPARCVLTVGTFDGLHEGHHVLMRTVVERARALDGHAAVYTFEPHPRKVLGGPSAPGLLTTLEQKLEVIAACGVDVTVVERFTREFAETPPERFVRDILWARFRPREVYVGYNFRFGHHREGSMRLLVELGPELGFEATIIPEVKVGGSTVSSTAIRQHLAAGEVEAAARLLGRPYALRGRVATGDRRGRALGFPTANLESENEVLPEAGVYAGRVRFLDEGDPPRGAELPAVTNLGRRPTFGEDLGLVAEAHLLDFSGDLYGRRVDVSFESRIRPERRFEGVEALRAQIARDVAEARRRLAGPAR